MHRRRVEPHHGRHLRRLAGVAALLLGTACGGGDDGTGPSGPAGRYDIVQVNDDRSAPFTAFEGNIEGLAVRLEIISGSIDLRTDGNYSFVATIRVLVNGISQGQQTPPAQTGRYEVSGTTVTFDPVGEDPEEPDYTGTLEGDTLTLTESGVDPDTGMAMSLTIVARR